MVSINHFMEQIAKSVDFKRAIYNVLTGKTHRGTDKELDIELNNVLTKFREFANQ